MKSLRKIAAKCLSPRNDDLYEISSLSSLAPSANCRRHMETPAGLVNIASIVSCDRSKLSLVTVAGSSLSTAWILLIYSLGQFGERRLNRCVSLSLFVRSGKISR